MQTGGRALTLAAFLRLSTGLSEHPQFNKGLPMALGD